MELASNYTFPCDIDEAETGGNFSMSGFELIYPPRH